MTQTSRVHPPKEMLVGGSGQWRKQVAEGLLGRGDSPPSHPPHPGLPR